MCNAAWRVRLLDSARMEGLSAVDRLRLLVRSHIQRPFDRRVLSPLRRLRNVERDYRPIFVAGASGSGTSLLAVSIGQQFDMAGIVYELDSEISADSFLAVPPLDSFGSVEEYLQFLSPSDSWSVDAGRGALLDVFRACTVGPAEAIVAKGPDMNLHRTAFLGRCFPNARFVLVFRDPVANIEGLRRKWKIFADEPLQQSIRFWAESHERFLADAETLTGRVLAVEYESLVADTEGALDRIGARCGLVPATTKRSLQTRPNTAGKGLRNVRNSAVGVVKDANREAIERMDPRDVDTIRAALTPLHERLRSAAAG
jgi:hypothetical protein